MSGTTKYVINKCYGGFGLSKKALLRAYELGWKGKDALKFFGTRQKLKNEISKPSDWRILVENNTIVLYGGDFSDDHSNPFLVQEVEELGEDANGEYAKLHIVEVPNDVEVEIDEYDGVETIRERSRYFG